MAASRIHKLGTIFSRTEGLLKSGALKWENRPIWYDIYETYPPLKEPTFFQDPPADQTVRNILYKEDILRARFAKKFGSGQVPNIDCTTKELPTALPSKFVTNAGKRKDDSV